MLIVLSTAPIAAPRKAMRPESAVTRIIHINFVRKISISVSVGQSHRRINLPSFNQRILQRIDVNSQTFGIKRQPSVARFHTIIETGSIVGLHRSLV